jgi:teichuronic acid biosynthesis glycosyltransferase TuaG
MDSIDSILTACSDFDYELILVLDGKETFSLETSPQIKEANQIRIIRQEQKLGVSKSLNRAIAISRGEFVFRMDSDDVWLANRAESQIAQIALSDKNIFFGNAFCINHRSRRIPKGLQLPGINLEDFSSIIMANFAYHPAVVFRGEWIRLHLYPESQIEDWAMWLKHISEIAPFQTNSEYVIAYRKHKAQTSKRLRLATNDQLVPIWIDAVESVLGIRITEKDAFAFISQSLEFKIKLNKKCRKIAKQLFGGLSRKGQPRDLLKNLLFQKGVMFFYFDGPVISPGVRRFIRFLWIKIVT